MTDRELLELAATAISMTDRKYYDDGAGDVGMVRPCGDLWNPLEDDGDALRLASCLRMVVSIHCATAMAQYYVVEEENVRTFKEDIPSIEHPHSATRRAIVRAAADIGRSMSHNVEVRGG